MPKIGKTKIAARYIETDDDKKRFEAKPKHVARGDPEKVRCLACDGSGVAAKQTQELFHNDEDSTCKNCNGNGWL